MEDDPVRVTVDDVDLPYGVHYARRMSHWLARLVPEPSERRTTAMGCAGSWPAATCRQPPPIDPGAASSDQSRVFSLALSQ